MAADLQFRIGAELTEIKGALAGLHEDFKRLGAEANGIGRGAAGIEALNQKIGSAANAAKALFAAFAASQIAQVFKSAAAAGVEFNAQLENANAAIASLIFAQSKLVDSQGKAVDGAEGLAVAYTLAAEQVQKLRIAGLETAATSTQLVEAFQTAVGPGIAAGLNLDQIRTLTIQITQAAGALNVPFDQLSQEIRSILDGSIDVNSRVAKTLGISNEQVKNWQAQGRLVQELTQLLGPFEEAGKRAADNFSVIASNAKEAIDTLGGEVFKGFFDQLKQGLKDATSGLFDTKNLSVASDLKDAVQFAQELATAIGGTLADALRGLVDLARQFSEYVKDNRQDLEDLRAAVGFVAIQFGKLVESVFSLVGGITDAGVKLNVFQGILLAVGLLVAGVRDGFRTISATVVGLGAIITKVLLLPFELLLDTAEKVASFLGKGELAKFLGDARDQIRQVSSDGLQAANDILQPIADGKGAVAEAIADMGKLADAAVKAQQQTKKASDEASKSGGKITGLRNPPKIPGPDPAQLEKADAERRLAILEQGYKDGLIATEDYYATRGLLQANAIDAEIAAEREKQARLQKNDENGQREAATRIALLRKKRQAALEDNNHDELQAARDLRVQLSELQAQDLENRGKLEEAASIRLAEQFRDLRNRLVLSGDEKSVSLIDKLIDTGKARAKFQELQTLIGQQTQGLQAKITEIQQQQITGQIDAPEAERQIQEARAATITQLDVLIAKLQELAAATNDPAIKQGAADAANALKQIGIDGATGLDLAIQQLRASMADLQKSFAASSVNAGVDALTNFFTDIASGAKSGADALKDFVRSFVASMAQIAARALATFLVLQALDAIFPGLGKAVSLTASVKHSGGMVGQGGASRSVDPALFFGAPRYHSGGMVGLKPDERPAILQTGEEVLSRTDPRNAANGGGQAGGGNGYRIVNVLDPALVSGYLESSAGERTVLNIIGRNPNAVKQSIGA